MAKRFYVSVLAADVKRCSGSVSTVTAVSAIAARAAARPPDSSNAEALMIGIRGVRKDGWITAIVNASIDVEYEHV